MTTDRISDKERIKLNYFCFTHGLPAVGNFMLPHERLMVRKELKRIRAILQEEKE